MPWIFFAAITILGATGIHFFSKMAKGSFDPIHGMILSMAAAFIVSLAFLPFASDPLNKIMTLNKGLMFYGLVGFCIAIAHLGIFLMFQAGAPLSIATPFVRFAPAVLAVILGLTLFHETLNYKQIIGLILAITGFYFLTVKS